MDSLKPSPISAAATGKSPTVTKSVALRTTAFEDALKTAQSLAVPRGAASAPATNQPSAESSPYGSVPPPAIWVSLLPSAASSYGSARSALGLDVD